VPTGSDDHPMPEDATFLVGRPDLGKQETCRAIGEPLPEHHTMLDAWPPTGIVDQDVGSVMHPEYRDSDRCRHGRPTRVRCRSG
jgi:hypothetical protein